MTTANGVPVRVRASEVAPLLAIARSSGVDVDALLSGLRLAWPEADAEMPLGDYFRLQNEISTALRDETMHLSSRQLLPGTTDFVMARLTGATSLLDAMRLLAQSYNLLHGGEYNSVRRRGDVVSFVTDDRRFPYTISDKSEFIQFSQECVQIFVHCMLAAVSSAHAHAGIRRVSVVRAARAAHLVHLEFWRAPIRFGAPVYALDYDFETASAPIRPSPEALSLAAVYAEIAAASASPRAAGRGGETADFVRQSLSRGVIDQTRIAALAGMSVATLRRKLEAEGASFRDLRREILNEAARSLLRRRMSVAEVAEQLGFSDVRAFNRAFRSWNGMTPKAFAAQAPR
jgi:AraC-like DNA-binding protein